MNQKIQLLDISWETIFKIAFAAFCFYIIYLIKDILVGFGFALIISILFEPAINFLNRKGLPRSLSVVSVYIFIFGILALTIYCLFPILFTEIKQFSQLFPQYFERIAPPLKGLGIEAFESMESFIDALGDFLQNASTDILSALSAIFGGIGSTMFIGFIALFLSLEERGTEKMLMVFIPKQHEQYALNLWNRCQAKTAGWFGSRVLTGIFIGILTFIALKVFNIKYAFTLAFIAGILEIIPIVGPLLTGFVAFMLVGLDSWLKALFVLGAFSLIQQIEGNLITPILTKKFVGLPPALVLISLAAGAKLLGILGAILAIPITGILFEFCTDFLKAKKEQEFR
ncbi:MAG: AI-2E family transporter [Patescibacteria group bacterium]|nr:AI-2E family transporter [Patescibacteria group bacterium]MBU1877279.1 AI-2E family transporter [Patescibacteria group bacterium]